MDQVSRDPVLMLWVWHVLRTMGINRDIPGARAVGTLDRACIQLLRGYARGFVANQMRNTRNPRLQRRFQAPLESLQKYLEDTVKCIVNQEMLGPEDTRLIQQGVVKSMKNLTDEQYATLWTDPMAAFVHCDAFRPLRIEAQTVISHVVTRIRRIYAVPPHTPSPNKHRIRQTA